VFLVLLATGVAMLAEPRFELNTAAVPRVIQPVDDFAYSPSPVTGSAVWSAEHLTRESLARAAERPSSFYVDDEVHKSLRARSNEYDGSGWDTGHLAPDADGGSEAAKRARARLTNVVPQAPRLNRGLWLQLERHVRELAGKADSVYVVTAPAYLVRNQPAELVGSLIRPTHLVKAVLVINAGQPAGMYCWKIPNETPPAGATLDAYRVTVDEAEALLQLDLFSWLEDSAETRMEATK
jgi:endonuclease G